MSSPVRAARYQMLLRRASRLRATGPAAVLAAVLVLALVPSTVDAAAFAARASVDPPTQYLNDSSGTLLTFTVRNTGVSHNIAAVEIKRPYKAWTIAGCPGAPAGWATSRTVNRCRYVSGAGAADDIKPGQTRTFKLRARTIAAAEGFKGDWSVLVSRTRSFGSGVNLRQAGPTGSGLTVQVFTFQILSAVLRSGPSTPGAACPAANSSGVAGSGGHTLVICGRNRSTGTIRPTAKRSRLFGTLIESHGGFTSGPVAPTSSSRVLGNWSNVTITDESGAGKTVLARVGRTLVKRSPLTELSGFTALNSPPVVTTSGGATSFSEGDPATLIDGALTVEDADDTTLFGARVRITSGFDAANDMLGFVDQSGIDGEYAPTTGVLMLTGSASVADYQAALRSVTFANASDNPGTSRSIAFRASDDGGDGAESTKSVAITAVNDPPVIDSTAPTTATEDTLYTYNATADDPDGPIATWSLSGADTCGGSVNASGVYTFTPAGPDPAATCDVGITVSDGGSPDESDSQTTTVTISAENDPPVVDSSAPTSATEDELYTYNATASDPEGSGLTWSLGGADTCGGAVNSSTGVYTFTPTGPTPPAQCDVGVTVTDDGSPPQLDTQTTTVTIIAVNDAPVIDTTDTALAYVEGDGAVAVDPAITVSELDSASIVGATLTISVGFDAAVDSLSFSDTATISGSWDGTTGVLTLTGADTAANYQLALRSVTYSNSGTSPGLNTATRTISIQVDDGGAVENLSNTATRDITVSPPNATPIAGEQGPLGTDEDTALPITLSATDADNDPLTFAIATAPANGVLGSIGTPDCSTTPGTCTAEVTYTPGSDYNGSDSFTFTVNDGTLDSAPGTVSITVSAVNDAPEATNLGAAQTYTEDVALNLTDIVVSDIDSASVTVTLTLSDAAAGTLSTATSGATTSTFVAGVWSATGPIADVNALLAVVTYTPASNFNANFTIATSVSDGVAAAVTGSKAMTGTPVNDAPEATNLNAAETYTEDTLLNLTDIVVSDIDSPNVTVTLTLSNTAAGMLSTSSSGTTNSTFSAGVWSAAGPIAEVNTLLAGVIFNPASNFNASFNITTSVSDGVAAALTGSKAMTGTPVNDAPVAEDKPASGQIDVQANMPRAGIDAALLTGVTDADSGDSGCTPTFSVASITSSTGGTVSNANLASGTFDFVPTPGFTGTALVNYTVSDDGCPGSATSAPAAISITVSGPVVWFVDDSVALTGNGNLGSPFKTLAEAVTAIGVDTNERIFLYDGTYTTGVALNAQGWLIGQPSTGASFDALMGITPPTGTAARPAIGSAGPVTVQNTVTLASSAKLQGLALATTTNTALAGSGGLTGVDVSQTSLTTTSGTALSLSDVAGTVTLTDLDKSGAGTGISLTNVGAAVTVSSAATIQNTTVAGIDIDQGAGAFSYAGTVSNASGRTVEVTNRSTGSPGLVQFTGSVTSTGGTGVNLDNNDAGTITFSGGLVLSTSTSTAFSATNGGTVNVTGSGNTLTTTTGRALNVQDTTIGGSGLTFQAISKNGGSSTAIFVKDAGSGGLTVTGTNSDASSGGVIQGITGTNGQSSTGIGVYVEDTNNVTLSNMLFGNATTLGNYAIKGLNVDNFTLRDSTINGLSGDDSGTENEAGIFFTNLNGVGVFEGNSISGGFTDNMRIQNSENGQTLNLFVRDSANDAAVFGSNGITNSGNDSLNVEVSSDGNVRMQVTGVQFTAWRGDGIQASALDTANLDATVTSNAFANAHPNIASAGGIGVLIGGTAGGGSWGVDYTIQGNTVTGSSGVAIAASFNGFSGTARGIISANTVGTSGGGYDASGSSQASGILVRAERSGAGAGSLTHYATVSNNQVRDVKQAGIFIAAVNGSSLSANAVVEATVNNNVVAEMGGASSFGGLVTQIGGAFQAGVVPDYSRAGLDINGNNLNINGTTAAYAPIFFDQIPDSQGNYYFPGYIGTDGSYYGGNNNDIRNYIVTTKGNVLTNDDAPLTGQPAETVWAPDARMDPGTLQPAQTGSNTDLPTGD